MKSLSNLSFLMVACLIFLLGWAPTARAHGDEPRLEISPERLVPGSVLEIRGVDFEFEAAIALSLLGTGGEISLGTTVADSEGIFHQIITVPSDLPAGTYTILAKSADHELQSPPFTVSGAPPVEGGGQGQREDEDGLLAAMPTYPPAMAAVPSPTNFPSPTARLQTSRAAGLSRPVLVLGGLILLGIALILVRKR